MQGEMGREKGKEKRRERGRDREGDRRATGGGGIVTDIASECQDNRVAAAVSARCKAKEIETGVSATKGSRLHPFAHIMTMFSLFPFFFFWQRYLTATRRAVAASVRHTPEMQT